MNEAPGLETDVEATSGILKISCHGCGQKLDVSDLEPFLKIFCPACNTELIVPRAFGNLLLEEKIGSGKVASVYRAIDLTLDREIAVKVLHQKFAQDEELHALFINEARIASAINHPNIIPIYSCSEEEGSPYIIMQFMEGGSLAQVQETYQDALPIAKVCQWFFEVAKGLESAYIHGVLHHDLSPSNIFLDMDENVKIGDFGLVKVLFYGLEVNEDGFHVPPDISQRRAWYISPERISTGRDDVQGDFFSFGATFYHLLTNQPPYSGDNVTAILRQRLEALPRNPSEIRPEIPRPISDLIMRCLSVYPSERPASYAEISACISEQFADEPQPEDSQIVMPVAKKSPRAKSSGHRQRSKKKEVSLPRKKRRAIPVARPVAQPGSGVPAAAPSASWLPRIILAVIIILLIFLLILHVSNPPWYSRTIRPLFQPTATQPEQP